MKRVLVVAAAMAATALFAGTSNASAHESDATIAQDRPAHPGKSDPQGQAKGHGQHKDPAQDGAGSDKPPASRPTAKNTPKNTPRNEKHGTAKGHAKSKAKPAVPAPTTSSPTRGRGNEVKKITFCHVPPGNPANGHLITTSVNAITPGHTNHSGDIIPPFSYLKHGSTVSFPGQNWDAAGQAALANGCTRVEPAGTASGRSGTAAPGIVVAGPLTADVPAGSQIEAPVQSRPGTDVLVESPLRGKRSTVSTTTGSADAPEDGNVIEGILPNTGGARLAVLLAGIALLVGGVFLVSRRHTA